jgi:hypothetical protein
MEQHSPLITPLNDGSQLLSLDIQKPWVRKLKFAGLGCFILFCCILLGGFAFLAHDGAFKKLTRDVRIVNGSVTEPNTHLSFPLNRPHLIDGTGGPQRLIGLFLKAKKVPGTEMTLHVFDLTLYVDREQGRKYLLKYKKGAPHAHNNRDSFLKFVDLIAGGQISFTGQYTMVMTAPGSHMHDEWKGKVILFNY